MDDHQFESHLFGFQIKRDQADAIEKLPSFVPPVRDDGAMVVQATGGATGTYVDLDGTVKNEAALVTQYRAMARNSEIDQAINHIVNEAIVVEDDQKIVTINFNDDDDVPDSVSNMLSEEFEEIQRMMEFKTRAYDIFRTWYVDGRIQYHGIIDPKKPKLGIQELRYIDPRKIRKIREVEKVPDPDNKGIVLTQIKAEYYIFNERGFAGGTRLDGTNTEMKGIKIAKDSILNCNSGIVDENGKMVLSYLDKAVKPFNQLRALEDAAVIYRLVRAPERRIFYIDVGNLPRVKAEQYLRDVMTRHKNKLVYDASTGDIRDDRKYMTMLEDFWFPRREGGKGTEVTTLPGGENLGQMDDVLYFQKKLYASLGVPLGRLNPDSLNAFGIATEITREEVNFSRFVDRIRTKFSELFLAILERHLILKEKMTPDEWQEIKHKIKFKYARDTYSSEIKNLEIIKMRAEAVTMIMPFIGRFYSNEWVRVNMLNQTEQQIKEIDKQIKKEASNPQYQSIDPDTGLPQDNPMDPNNPEQGDSPMGVDNAMSVVAQPTDKDAKLDKNGKPLPKPKPAKKSK